MNTPETGEISIHETKVFAALKQNVRWLTNHEIAQLAGVAERTARAHSRKLVDLGIVDRAQVFPGHRFMLSPAAEERNKQYLTQLEFASGVLGVVTEDS